MSDPFDFGDIMAEFPDTTSGWYAACWEILSLRGRAEIAERRNLLNPSATEYVTELEAKLAAAEARANMLQEVADARGNERLEEFWYFKDKLAAAEAVIEAAEALVRWNDGPGTWDDLADLMFAQENALAAYRAKETEE